MSLVHLQLEMLLRVCRVYYVPFFTGLKHFVVCPNLRLHNTFPSYDFFFFFFFFNNTLLHKLFFSNHDHDNDHDPYLYMFFLYV